MRLEVPEQCPNELSEFLSENLVGQEPVIAALSKQYLLYEQGLLDPRKPRGSFFLLGPTGVGKTSSGIALAKYFEVEPLIIDCAEYQDTTARSKLTGVGPGWVGFDNEPILSSEVIDREDGHPSVLIVDEIEKAEPGVVQLFLGILDRGETRLGTGEIVNFSNCWIIFTSNIGTNESKAGSHGFHANETSPEEAVKRALQKRYSPEFLNRLTSIVVFKSLSKADILGIVDLEIDKLQDVIAASEVPVFIRLEDDAKELMSELGYSPTYGARYLSRTISEHLSIPLGRMMKSKLLKRGDSIVVTKDAGNFAFNRREVKTKPEIFKTTCKLSKTAA